MDHIVVTILHNKEIVDWNWNSNPFSNNFGEEYPVYEDDPFYLVELYTDKFGVVTYGELPKGCETKDVEYHICSDLQDLAEIVPTQLFGEILCDISEGGDW